MMRRATTLRMVVVRVIIRNSCLFIPKNSKLILFLFIYYCLRRKAVGTNEVNEPGNSIIVKTCLGTSNCMTMPLNTIYTGIGLTVTKERRQSPQQVGVSI